MEFMSEKKVTKKTVVKKVAAKAPKAKPVKTEPELPEVLLKSVKFLDDKKAENIVVLDLRDVANISDYFVVATAANAPHLKALGDGLKRLFKNEQYEGFRAAGSGDSGWVIADYYGVMVHVFSFEMRNLYDLEKLWKDAKLVEIPTA
jgi:ribosome-associated protein